MNERIQELHEQAMKSCDEHRSDILNYHRIYREKFAKLIVLECEKVAKDPKWYGESPSNGWRNPIRHVCNVMKEHFGVEL